MKTLLFIVALVVATTASAQMRYRGTGPSMLPTYKDGQEFLVYPLKWEALKVGMIVLRDNGPGKPPTCHRLIQYIWPFGWVTKGDGNPRPDAGFMTRKTYLGRAVPVEPIKPAP